MNWVLDGAISTVIPITVIVAASVTTAAYIQGTNSKCFARNGTIVAEKSNASGQHHQRQRFFAPKVVFCWCYQNIITRSSGAYNEQLNSGAVNGGDKTQVSEREDYFDIVVLFCCHFTWFGWISIILHFIIHVSRIETLMELPNLRLKKNPVTK